MQIVAPDLARFYDQVAGSEWKLVEEGKSAEVQDQEPQFSTWDDVMNAKQGRSKQQTASSSTARPAPSGSATDDTLYRYEPIGGSHFPLGSLASCSGSAESCSFTKCHGKSCTFAGICTSKHLTLLPKAARAIKAAGIMHCLDHAVTFTRHTQKIASEYKLACAGFWMLQGWHPRQISSQLTASWHSGCILMSTMPPMLPSDSWRSAMPMVGAHLQAGITCASNLG